MAFTENSMDLWELEAVVVDPMLPNFVVEVPAINEAEARRKAISTVEDRSGSCVYDFVYCERQQIAPARKRTETSRTFRV